MRKLDRRGVAAFEFCLVGGFIFVLIFTIIDLGRYAITVQSLRALADAGARALMVGDAGNACYTDAAISRSTPACSGDPLSDSAKQAIAPFLFSGGLTPTLSVSGSSPIVVTASQPGFTMLFTGWGSSFNAPSASTKIPAPF